MKKINIFILTILLSLTLLTNSFAYFLNENEKISLDKVVSKIESIISNKGESYRNLIIDKLKVLSASKDGKVKNYIDYVILALNKVQNSNISGNYEEIFKKIEENIKAKENEKPKTVLIQGDFKAEYISNNGDYTKSDKIRITQNGKSWEIPGGYSLEENKSKITCVNEFIQRGVKFEDIGGDCGILKFLGFDTFSPSGYYLSVKYGGMGVSPFFLLDVRKGNIILSSNDVSFTSWTKDKSQFIYGQIGRVGEVGLYITEKGSFPKVKKLLQDDEVYGGYIDEKNIYIKVGVIDIDPKTGLGTDKEYYKVIEIETGKVIYSKEIK